MKKFLSVLVVVAMLVTAMSPAFTTSATGGLAISAGENGNANFVLDPDAEALTATLPITITENPGISELQILVYYTNTEITISNSDETETAFTDAVSVGLAKRSTASGYRSAFTSNGVATGAAVYLADVSIFNADIDGNPVNTTETGLVSNLEVTIGAACADLAEGDTFTYGIIIAGAYDENGDDVPLADDLATWTGTITAVSGDKYRPYAEERTFPTDQFTVYADNMHVFAGHGDTTVNVGINLAGNTANNPKGIWAFRTVVYYVPEISVASTANASIYLDEAFNPGTPNIALTAESHQSVRLAMQSSNVEFEDNQYNFTVIYYQPKNAADQYTADGTVCNLVFNIPADAEAGDEWAIGLASHTADISDCDNADVPFVLKNGSIKIDPILPAYEPIDVTGFGVTADRITIDPTKIEGTIPVNLNLVNNAANNAKGIWAFRVVVYYDPSISVTTVENGTIFQSDAFNPGTVNIPLTSSSHQSVRLAMQSSNVEFEDNQYNYTVIYYQPKNAADQYTADGVVTTFNFELPETVNAGDEWTIGLASHVSDISNCDNEDVPFTLYNGYIRAYGACQHPEPYRREIQLATCTIDGWTRDYCTKCGALVNEVIDPATGHTAGEVITVTAPTCTLAGVGKTVCTVCGADVETDKVITALGHVAGERVVTQEPTYDEPGAWAIYCTRDGCGEILETGTIPPIPKANISVGQATGKTNGTVDVDVNIDHNDTGLFIATFDVAYDATVLTLDSITNGTVFADASNVLFSIHDGTATLYFEGASDENVIGNGKLATLHFTIADDATKVGEYPITVTLDPNNAISYAGENVKVDTADGSVTVQERETIAVATASVEECKTVEIPVSVSANSGFWGFRAEYTYDAAALTFTGIDSGLFTVAEGVNYSVANGVITVFVENATTTDMADNGVLYTLKFTANKVVGTAAVTMNVVDLINAAEADLTTFKYVDGAVDVTACTHANTHEVVTTAPTITSEGVMSVVCDNCDDVISTHAIAKVAAIFTDEVACQTFEDVTVPVRLSSNPGIWSVGMEFAYDASKLSFKGITGGLFSVDDGVSYSVANGVITVFVENGAIADIAEDGVIFNLNFKALNTAGAGDQVITATMISGNTINAAGEDVAFVAVNGKIATTYNPNALIAMEAGFGAATVAFDEADDHLILVDAALNAPGATAAFTVNGKFTCDSLKSANDAIKYVRMSDVGSSEPSTTTMTIVTPLGKTETYTVKYTFHCQLTAEKGVGYNAKEIVLRGADITVKVARNSAEGTFYFDIPEGVTYVNDPNLATTVTGNRVYFTASYFDHVSNYIVRLQAANGNTVHYVIKFAWDLSPLRDLRGGSMVTSYSVRNADITLNAHADDAYASFRYIFNNETTVVTPAEGIEVVTVGALHYYKIVNDGSGTATTTMHVKNTANNYEFDYVITVNFVG